MAVASLDANFHLNINGAIQVQSRILTEHLHLSPIRGLIALSCTRPSDIEEKVNHLFAQGSHGFGAAQGEYAEFQQNFPSTELLRIYLTLTNPNNVDLSRKKIRPSVRELYGRVKKYWLSSEGSNNVSFPSTDLKTIFNFGIRSESPAYRLVRAVILQHLWSLGALNVGNDA